MSEIVLTLTPNPAVDLWMTTTKFEVGPKLRCSNPKIDPGGGGAAGTWLTEGTNLCREEDVDRLLSDVRGPRRI